MSDRRRRRECTGSIPANCRPTCGAAVDQPGLRVSRSAFLAGSHGRVVSCRRFAGNADVLWKSSPKGAKRDDDRPVLAGAISSSSSSAVAPGLEVVSVGPPESVESWHTDRRSAAAKVEPVDKRPGRLSIRLSLQARDRNKVTSQTDGDRADQDAGIDQARVVFVRSDGSGERVFCDCGRARSGSGAGRRRRAAQEFCRRSSLDFRTCRANCRGGRCEARARPSVIPRRLRHSRYLPIRVTRHERLLRHETILSAQVSPRSVEVIERMTFSVRYGDLKSSGVSGSGGARRSVGAARPPGDRDRGAEPGRRTDRGDFACRLIERSSNRPRCGFAIDFRWPESSIPRRRGR